MFGIPLYLVVIFLRQREIYFTENKVYGRKSTEVVLHLRVPTILLKWKNIERGFTSEFMDDFFLQNTASNLDKFMTTLQCLHSLLPNQRRLFC